MYTAHLFLDRVFGHWSTGVLGLSLPTHSQAPSGWMSCIG